MSGTRGLFLLLILLGGMLLEAKAKALNVTDLGG